MARRLLAQTYLRLGQPAKALTALEPLLTKAAGDAKAAALAAEAHLQTGDLRQAEANFAKAAELDPHDVKSHVALAMTRINKGEAIAAMAELESIAAIDKGTYANLALVSAYLRNKDYARALKAIDALEAKQPDRPMAANLRGRVHLMRKDVPEARRSFERALVIDPVFVPAASSLAQLDLADNKPEVAKQRFEAVLAADPKNLQALLAIVGMRAKAGASSEELAGLLANAVKLNPTEVDPRVFLVDHFLGRQDTKAALVAARDAVAAFPSSPKALDALGRAQVASGDTNQAIVSFGKLASLDPQSPAAHLRLAGIHLASKSTEAAIQSVKRALTITPNILAAQQLLVGMEIEAKRPQEALLVARTVQKQRPGEAAGYMLEGAVEVARRNLPAAAEIYRAVLKKFPSTDPAVRLHSVLVASAKNGEADKFASSWIAAHPQDAGFLFHLAEMSLVNGNYAAAEAQFQGVLRTAPNDAAALNNVAWIMTKLNKPGAVAYAQKANALAPKAPAFLDTLATALAAENKVEGAIDVQKKAIALAPGDPALRLNLAKIYVQAGDKAKARSELESLSKAGDKSAAEAELLLKKL